MLKVTAIIVIAFVSYSFASTCRERIDRACSPPVIEERFPGAIPDVSFLDEHCGSVLNFVKCITDFNETCRLEAFVSDITFREMHDITSEICDAESEIGKAYRENVDCVNDKKDEFFRARDAYEMEIRQFAFYLINHVEDYESINYETIVNCIDVQIADRHMRKFLEGACGEGTVKVLERIERVFLNHCPSPQSMLRFRVLYDQFLEEKRDMIEEEIK